MVRGIKETTVKPFRGGPKTVVLTDRDDVTKGIRVQPKYLTPLGAIVADVAAKLSTVALVGYSVLTVMEMPEPNWLVPVLMPLAYFPLKYLFRFELRSSLTIDLLDDAVVVRRFLLPVRYDRSENVQFAVSERHVRADLERARHEVAARKDQLRGKARHRTKYYECAKHLLLIVGGESCILGSGFEGHEMAQIADRANRANQLVLAQRERREHVRALDETNAHRAPGQLPE